MLESSCALKSSIQDSATRTNFINRGASDRPTFAKAHAKLSTPDALRRLSYASCHSSALENAAKSWASAWPAVANAQPKRASWWASNSPACRSAAFANDEKRKPNDSTLSLVAAPHAVSTSDYPTSSPLSANTAVCRARRSRASGTCCSRTAFMLEVETLTRRSNLEA